MSSRMKPNKRRIRKDNIRLIKAALKEGTTTVTQISKATGITRSIIHGIFKEYRELHAKYVVARKMVVDKAADNIADIIDDQEHPNNFAASKFVLQRYKSDLDEHLESQDDNEITAEVEVENNGEGNGGVKIVFTTKRSNIDKG